MLKYPKLSKERCKEFLEPYYKIFGIRKKKKKIEEKSFKPAQITLPTQNTKVSKGTIKMEGIIKKFGKNLVLNGISLEIKPGELFGIIGVNGSGKTTLLKTLIGFYRPTKGVVSFKGYNIRKAPDSVKMSFGFASQENSFYGKLNVEENIKYFGELYGLTDEFIDAHIENILRLVDLYEARKTLGDNLSNGMKRRLDIACALIHDPSVLILDEPTQDLDPNLRKSVLKLIQRINKNGTTVIITSHLLWEMEAICSRVAVLAEGRILQVGSPNQLKEAYTKNHEIHLETHPGNYDKILKGIRDIKKVVKLEHKVLLYTNKPEKVLKQLLARIHKNREKLIDVSVRKPNLTEVFSGIIKKHVKKI
jgi:ABC-2 type transport system ATP-binding protein